MCFASSSPEFKPQFDQKKETNKQQQQQQQQQKTVTKADFSFSDLIYLAFCPMLWGENVTYLTNFIRAFFSHIINVGTGYSYYLNYCLVIYSK
jgi:hypothetical protein